MLNLAVSNVYVFFNNVLIEQNEGISIGNPLAPTLINILFRKFRNNFFKCLSCRVQTSIL